jgi:hypothetical protein
MPGSQRFGFDHRFAIEDLLDQYLDAFKRRNRVAAASEGQEVEQASAEAISAPEEGDQAWGIGATGWESST